MNTIENSNKKDIFLSICIPTYNRANKTVDLVKSILSNKDLDIEVVVLDNCSTDDTQLLLKEIKDERFIYKKNDLNIGSMPNLLKVLTYGTGEFKMLCLDKDRIICKNLIDVISHIRDDNEVVFGQCKLNIEVKELDLVYDQGLSSIYNLAYTSEHPSGLFLKNSILSNSKIINKINNENKTFAFNTELLKAEMAIFGKSKRINIPLIQTETLEVCEKEISHTYKGSNIYFFPKNIIETFNIYVNNLYNLNLPYENKNIVLMKIFSSLLISSTFGFKNIMKNKSICMHHGVNPRNISMMELVKIDFAFSKSFIKKDLPISILCKIYICLIAQIKVVFIFSFNKFKY